jgi:hypothetical protein
MYMTCRVAAQYRHGTTSDASSAMGEGPVMLYQTLKNSFQVSYSTVLYFLRLFREYSTLVKTN